MKKCHHFIPQFYLKKFALQEPNETIWTYDTQEKAVCASTVENTVYEKYLYSVMSEDGKRRDDIEDIIAGIEDKAAPLLEKLVHGNLTEKQVEELREAMLDPGKFVVQMDKQVTLPALGMHDSLAPIFLK